jgi:hypothetical protein
MKTDNKQKPIIPTIGRKVWFWTLDATYVRDQLQAFDATIIYVHNPELVDLSVTTHAGTATIERRVKMEMPEACDHHGTERIATWMPFQAGQARKDAATAGDINPTGEAQREQDQDRTGTSETSPGGQGRA